MNEHPGISIAVLTENQDDVEVVNGTLRDAGHVAHCRWLATPKQFADALESETIELIIQNIDGYRDSVRQTIKLKDAYATRSSTGESLAGPSIVFRRWPSAMRISAGVCGRCASATTAVP